MRLSKRLTLAKGMLIIAIFAISFGVFRVSAGPYAAAAAWVVSLLLLAWLAPLLFGAITVGEFGLLLALEFLVAAALFYHWYAWART